MTLGIVAAVDTALAQPRIRLDVAADPALPAPVGDNTLIAVFRVDPDGRQRRVILEAGARLSGGDWTGYDYHAPFNETVSYSVGAAGYTAPSNSVTLVSSDSWLMHPTNPLLSVQLTAVKSFGDIGKEATSVVSFPFDQEEPIALYEGTRHANDGELTIEVRSKANLQAINALFADSGPVLLNLAGDDLGSAWRPEDWAWVLPGKTTVSDPVQNAIGDLRYLSFPYQVIGTPGGLALPVWTCGDVTANYATCADVTAAYATCGDLTTNTLGSAPTGSLIPDPVTPGLFVPIGLTEDPSNPGLYLLSA